MNRITIQEWYSWVKDKVTAHPTALINFTQRYSDEHLLGEAFSLSLGYIESVLISKGMPYFWNLEGMEGCPGGMSFHDETLMFNRESRSFVGAHRNVDRDWLDAVLRVQYPSSCVKLYMFPGKSTAPPRYHRLRWGERRYGKPVSSQGFEPEKIEAAFKKLESEFGGINAELQKASKAKEIRSLAGVKSLPLESPNQYFSHDK